MNLVAPDERPGRARRPGANFGRPSRATALWALALASAAAGALAVEGRRLANRAAAAETERQELAAQVAERDRAARALESDRETLRELHARERRLRRWDEERSAPAELLRGLSQRVTDEVIFEELRRENGQLWITGRVTAGEALSAATEELSRTGRLEQIELLWVERTDESAAGQRFAVAAEIRYETADPDPPPPAGEGPGAALTGS